jgi:hypothetical protein
VSLREIVFIPSCQDAKKTGVCLVFCVWYFGEGVAGWFNGITAHQLKSQSA